MKEYNIILEKEHTGSRICVSQFLHVVWILWGEKKLTRSNLFWQAKVWMQFGRQHLQNKFRNFNTIFDFGLQIQTNITFEMYKTCA